MLCLAELILTICHDFGKKPFGCPTPLSQCPGFQAEDRHLAMISECLQVTTVLCNNIKSICNLVMHI